jgi:Zn-finger nucleic acid-binding protein
MQRRNFRKKSGVIIDSCPSHGIWLDADELEQIAGFILSGGGGSSTLRESAQERQQKAATAAAFARVETQALNRRYGATQDSSSFRQESGVVESIANFLSNILK